MLVGERLIPFGDDLQKLTGPRYAEGYLPIVQLEYAEQEGRYRQEVFASTNPELAASGAMVVKFEFPGRDRGRIELDMESGNELLTGGAKQHAVLDANKRILLAYDNNFEWRAARSALMSKEKHDETAYVIVFTQPADPAQAKPASEQLYKEERALCAKTWNELLAAGTNVRVPESYVNDAWRSLIVGTYMIYAGEQLNYSAGNQYARKYAHESGETMRSLLLWGHVKDAGDAIPSILKYRRKNIEFHDGGYKLEGVADYYFATHDGKLVRDTREPMAAGNRSHCELARSENGVVAARKVLQRHRYAGHIDQRQCELLARVARYGLGARRYGRERGGGEAGKNRCRLS